MTRADEHDHRAEGVRLLEALRQPDGLSCADAEVLIAMLVEAGAMGKDVDDDPVFAPVLRHLDHCADCLTVYEELTEEVAATMAQQLGREAVVPNLPRPPQRVNMQPIQPVRRCFEIIIQNPKRRETMLREYPAPYGVQTTESLAQVVITEGEHSVTLRVLVLDHPPGTSWLVVVTAGDLHAEARTDAAGVAIFEGIPADVMVRVTGIEEG